VIHEVSGLTKHIRTKGDSSTVVMHTMKAKSSSNQRVNEGFAGLQIPSSTLQRVCGRMIETLLVCLPNAVSSTIYSIGPIPHLRLKPVASARRYGQTDQIRWEGLYKSAHNFTTKKWVDYRDHKGGILEAITWCVENQTSWTVDYASPSPRNMKESVENKAADDYYHLEPILIKKAELLQRKVQLHSYPKDRQGKPIWQDSPNTTVAVVKIDLLPGTIARGDRSTRVINTLSAFLGTQMLSLHAIQSAVDKSKLFQKERHKMGDKLSHDFRSIIAKLGLVYRVIDHEISNLRESWEALIQQYYPKKPYKRSIVRELNEILQEIELKYKYNAQFDKADIQKLQRYQKQLLEYCLLPEQNKIWLRQKIRPLWISIASKFDLTPSLEEQIELLLERLEESFSVFLDKELIDEIDFVTEPVRKKWIRLAYTEMDWNDKEFLQEYIDTIDSLSVVLDHRRHSSKNLVYLKSLVELMPELQQKLESNLALLQRDIDLFEASLE
jgi:hypothetical protein